MDIPSFHDATLIGILAPSDETVWLFIRTVPAATVCVELTGVQALRADNLHAGNVVLDLECVSPELIKIPDIVRAYSSHETLTEPLYQKSEQAFYEGIHHKVRAGELVLVRLNPSYGCALSCICSGVSTKSASGMAFTTAFKR